METFRKVAIAALAPVSLGVAIAAVALLARGDDNAPIEVVLPGPTEVTQKTLFAVDANSLPEQTKVLKVYVAGAVLSPDVYELPPGARLNEALAAAGGPTDDADLIAVNLARRVQDEGYYFIPQVGETPPPIASAPTGPDPVEPSLTPGGGPATNTLINLNTASVEELDRLPGIGPAKAQAIVAHREGNGGFQSVEDITSVSGIGPATYQKIKDLVTVDSLSGSPATLQP